MIERRWRTACTAIGIVVLVVLARSTVAAQAAGTSGFGGWRRGPSAPRAGIYIVDHDGPASMDLSRAVARHVWWLASAFCGCYLYAVQFTRPIFWTSVSGRASVWVWARSSLSYSARSCRHFRSAGLDGSGRELHRFCNLLAALIALAQIPSFVVTDGSGAGRARYACLHLRAVVFEYSGQAPAVFSAVCSQPRGAPRAPGPLVPTSGKLYHRVCDRPPVADVAFASWMAYHANSPVSRASCKRQVGWRC